MEDLPEWATLLIALGGAIGTLVTAVATFFLWRVTRTLAVATQTMADAAAQPHIVATITPNVWSMRHFDIHIENTGNSTAYEIHVEFDPPLQNGEPRSHMSSTPFQNVSLLKPGHQLSSHLSDYERLKGKLFKVKICWKRSPSASDWQTNKYELRMQDYESLSQLGNDPLVQIATHIKRLEEEWRPVAKSRKRNQVDVFTNADRARELRQTRRQRLREADRTGNPGRGEKETSAG